VKSNHHIGSAVETLNLVAALLWGATGIVCGVFGFGLIAILYGLFGEVIPEIDSKMDKVIFFVALFVGFSSFFLLSLLVGRVRSAPGEDENSTRQRALRAVRAAGIISGITYAIIAAVAVNAVVSHRKYKTESARERAFLSDRFQIDTLICSRSTETDSMYVIEIPLRGQLNGAYTITAQVANVIPTGILWEEKRHLTLNQTSRPVFRVKHEALEGAYCSLVDPEGYPMGGAAILEIRASLSYDALAKEYEHRAGFDSSKRIDFYTDFECGSLRRR
jgi:hypothetical protein